MSIDLLPGFTDAQVDVGDGISLRVRTSLGTDKPPLLCLHGHPQTHLIWHKVAPALRAHFSLVLADLRGYGDSAKPPGEADHANYSKRAMAVDQLRLMRQLGFDRFRVLAHDRGARVAHRLAIDHADSVERLVLLDIAPTLAMYEGTSFAFAAAYWHWFFLIQRAPIPERFITADPAFYIEKMIASRFTDQADLDRAFAPQAMAEYVRCLQSPQSAHALCEDYRASATIDLNDDRDDRARGCKLSMPMLILWGQHGVIERCFDPLEEWRRVATDVTGKALPCGHYIPEEAPAALLEEALPFLLQSTHRRDTGH